jgi:DNA-directed RNA polymerase specialized sigma24 family protein
MRACLYHLHRTAYLLCGDAHLAEDLVQSTALALYRKWHRVQAADNIDAYVRRVLVNEFLGERRRPWSRVVLFDRTPELAASSPGDLCGRPVLTTRSGTGRERAIGRTRPGDRCPRRPL